MDFLHHSVKRGFEQPAMGMMFKRTQEEIDVPGWGMALLMVTFYGFIVGISLMNYTLKDVVATLAMIETPSSSIAVSASSDAFPATKDTKEPLLETGPTITLVSQKPITSKIRGTIQHLVAQAGRWSRFRGLLLFALYTFSFHTLTSFLLVLLAPVPGRLLFATGLASAALANLHAAWTHKVISLPSEKGLLARIPGRKSWKNVALPAVVEGCAKYVSAYSIYGLVMLLGLHKLQDENFANYTSAAWVNLLGRGVLVILFAICCGLFINLPALVTLVRVEASLLPEDEDTIVPFDRTFNGKVAPGQIVRFLDAWKSFTWEARRRLVKLFAKIVAIIVALSIAVLHVLLLEMWFVMGPQLAKKLHEEAGRAHHG